MSGAFELESARGAAVFVSRGAGAPVRRLRVCFVREGIARVTFTQDRGFADRESRIVLPRGAPAVFEIDEDEHAFSLRTKAMRVEVLKCSGALSFFMADGRLLFREPERGGKWLTARPVMRNVFAHDAAVQIGESIDGVRARQANFTAVLDREAFEAKLEFCFAEDEALFGLGSHEEGYANLRGCSRELYQQNMKAVVPHLVSTRGYGVLMDCGSLMAFHDDALGSYWWADCVDELDFYVLAGGDYDGVMREYRALTGAPPLPPLWAFGYVQSKERYVTAQEMIEVVAEYRRREIPLDVIVLDWKSWPNEAGWGQKSFDPQRFPDPRGFIDALHAMHARLMVSIWPIMTGGCDNQRELQERGLMLGNGATYDAFDDEARAVYWEQARRGLFVHGVDAWWCDCTEPFEADWSGAVKPEPHKRLALNTGESKQYLDDGAINEYSLLHSRGIYEGQRAADANKRVLNLTRSSYAGQSRYGTVTWNGDICATWETLRRSVAEGLNFCATGEPYWTVDAGGFFLDRRDDLWFWRGDYRAGARGLTDMHALAPDPKDTGCTDLGFHELYTRWMQYAAFLPMFRSHGTDAAREIWRFGEPGTPFYDAIAAAIRLRYALLPTIYSMAAAVTSAGGSMLRALALGFPGDRRARDVGDQFLFGEALMVCPVLEPMFYERESRALQERSQTRSVYLPEGAGWFDFATGRFYRGGQRVDAGAPLERIPVFARAGSIVMIASPVQYVAALQHAEFELRVFAGADAAFCWYEDAGDGYAYEQGECSRVMIRWDDAGRVLRLEERKGEFSGMVRERVLRVVVQIEDGVQTAVARYTGSAQQMSMANGAEA